jgi:hypothetical protein
MDGADKEEVRKSVENIISMGSKIVGAAAGVTAGTLLVSPYVGAIISPFISGSFEKIGKEVVARRFGPRQEARIGAFISFASSKINSELNEGKNLRDGDYFETTINDRSSSDEIAEHLLTVSANAFEELKLKYMGNLFSRICFDKSIDRGSANHLISIVENLSYRGFVLINLAKNIEIYNIELRQKVGTVDFSPSLVSLNYEIYEMCRKGILLFSHNSESNVAYAILGPNEIEPAQMRLTDLGKHLYDFLDLYTIQNNDTVKMNTIDDLKKISMTSADAGYTLDGGTA